jgi:predicted acylesterase/phospholipase RssA
VHHVRRGNAADLARLGRLSLGVGYGLVLGGGGARGFAHLGVLRSLQESGVPIDRIGGASMGSIFGAASALYQDLDEITTLCKRQFRRLFDYTIPVVSLLKAKRITANLTEVFAGLDVDDLWVPFHCVSTNLTRSQLHIHRDGELVTALRASIAIPGVLPPVPFGDELLVDGGVLDNVPADVMRADRSIGTVIASDVAPPTGPAVGQNYGMFLSGWQALRHPRRRRRDPMYPGVGSVLIRTMITGSEGRRAQMKADGTVDLYLDAEMHGVGLLEFDRMSSITERGYAGSREQVAAWAATRSELQPR